MTRNQRRQRQTFWGLASIICSIVGTIAFFGGALVHDFAGGDFQDRVILISGLWATSAISILTAILCLVHGMES